MIGISLTVIVCVVTIQAASDGEEVRSCEVYNETRPVTDLQPCLYRQLRDELGREALAHAGRQLQSEEQVETTCRMMIGGGIPTG